jgi:hypothetical protein
VIGILIMGLQLIVGIAFLYAGFTGFFSKEGKYTAENAQYMNVSYFVGMVLGAMLLGNLFGLTNVPYVPLI